MLGMAERFSGEWRSVKLGDVVRGKLSYGINAAAVPYDGKNPAYIRITDITEYGRYNAAGKVSVIASTREREKYRLREGDIVLARTGSVGKSYLYDPKDGELIYAGYLIKASINCEKCDPRYVFYQLHTRRYWSWIATMSKRSVQSGINSKEYALFTFPLPPLDEQIAIADTLSAFDRHLANLSELIAKHEGIRAGALEDLLSGRTRLPGFSGEWRTVKAGDIVKIIRGVSYSEHDAHRERLSGDCLILRGGNVLEDGHITITDSDNVYVSGNLVKDKQRIRKNDVVIVSSTASMRVIGKAGIIDADYSDVAHGAFLMLIRPIRSQNIVAEYVSWYFTTHEYRHQIKHLVAGGVIQNIKLEHIKNLMIPVPPVDEQIAIAQTLSALDLNISNLKAEHAKISALRIAAINDLLTAKIRLPRPH